MRRILCLMLAAIMLMTLAACGDDHKPANDDTSSDGTDTPVATEEPTTAPVGGKHEVISLDFINTFDHKPSMEEQSVYDKNDLTVKATGIRYDTVSGPQILLNIHNGTDKQVLIQNNHTVVNGFMMTPEINVTVPAGKTVDTPMSLPYLRLAMADIHTITELEFSLRILDSMTYAVIDTTEPVRPALTDTDPDAAPYDEEGQVAFDGKDVKVVLKGLKHDTLFDSDSVVMVYMDNRSDKTVTVLNTELTVNGYDVTTAMHTVILPGKRAVDVIELYDNELEENGVTAVDTVDVAFNINDYESWDLIAETGVVSLDLPVSADAEAAEQTTG